MQTSSILFITVLGLLISFFVLENSNAQETIDFNQEYYVTDDFEIMFRAGPSIQNKIIKPLRSGTTLHILREDAGNGHSQVQTKNGEIGYVLTRFISDKPTSKSQLAIVQQQLDDLRSQPGELRQKLANSLDSERKLQRKLQLLETQLEQANAQIANIMQVSGDSVEMAQKNQKLTDEIKQLLLQLDDIRIQNETLKDSKEQRTMLISASFVFLGLFLGWILSVSGNRRRKW